MAVSYPSPIRPNVGDTVHVSGAEGICSPAIVIDSGDDDAIRLRVFYRAPVTEPVGSRDVEGWYVPQWRAASVPSPDGTRRVLDSWHWRYHR